MTPLLQVSPLLHLDTSFTYDPLTYDLYGIAIDTVTSGMVYISDMYNFYNLTAYNQPNYMGFNYGPQEYSLISVLIAPEANLYFATTKNIFGRYTQGGPISCTQKKCNYFNWTNTMPETVYDFVLL